ncbi:unnamed protein product [Pleuronectes platessa]|uniref:Uncharacterized protein n=1 Tax=Pleuronectes platessa TaxID=8262 RepID=A0A9N7W191_PLEPL|nr:unnamed protein product [Pleuronectes platessa]
MDSGRSCVRENVVNAHFLLAARFVGRQQSDCYFYLLIFTTVGQHYRFCAVGDLKEEISSVTHLLLRARRSVIVEHLQAQGSRHNTPNAQWWSGGERSTDRKRIKTTATASRMETQHPPRCIKSLLLEENQLLSGFVSVMADGPAAV